MRQLQCFPDIPPEQVASGGQLPGCLHHRSVLCTEGLMPLPEIVRRISVRQTRVPWRVRSTQRRAVTLSLDLEAVRIFARHRAGKGTRKPPLWPHTKRFRTLVSAQGSLCAIGHGCTTRILIMPGSIWFAGACCRYGHVGVHGLLWF